MRKQKWTIALLATAGVLASTFIVGGLSWWVLRWLDQPIPFLYCLLFGALISPTDPVAVLGLVRQGRTAQGAWKPRSSANPFSTTVSAWWFLQCCSNWSKAKTRSARLQVGGLFLQEAGGGILFGLVLGLITYAMLKQVDNYQVEILLTLAMVMGGFALADASPHLGAAGDCGGRVADRQPRPLLAMSETTRKNLDTFWELVDEILNGVLFVLIGLEVLVIPVTIQQLLAGLAIIPVALLARWISAGGAIKILQMGGSFSPGTVTLITWGGLRGGISVAMALSLPHVPARQTILVITYVVVVFSILVQGLTLEKVARRFVQSSRSE